MQSIDCDQSDFCSANAPISAGEILQPVVCTDGDSVIYIHCGICVQCGAAEPASLGGIAVVGGQYVACRDTVIVSRVLVFIQVARNHRTQG